MSAYDPPIQYPQTVFNPSNWIYTSTTTTSSGGTPGGSSTQVQFNDNGSFGGDAGMTYNKTSDVLTVSNITSSGTSTLTNIVSTGTANTTTLTATNATVDNNLVVSNETSLARTCIGSVIDEAFDLQVGLDMNLQSASANYCINGSSVLSKTTLGATVVNSSLTSHGTLANGCNIATGQTYKVNNVNTLSATTLGSAVVNSSLTNLGTLTGLTCSGTATFSGTTNLNGTLSIASGNLDTVPTSGSTKLLTSGSLYSYYPEQAQFRMAVGYSNPSANDFVITWNSGASSPSTNITLMATTSQIQIARPGVYIFTGSWFSTDSATTTLKSAYWRAYDSAGNSYDSGFRYGFTTHSVYGCMSTTMINITSANSYVIFWAYSSSTAIAYGGANAAQRTQCQIIGPLRP